MIKLFILLIFGILLFPMGILAEPKFPSDRIETDSGPLDISMIGHGTLMLTFANKVIHIDPWTRLADYTQLPKADLILVTHGHMDHFDAKAVEDLRKEATRIIVPKVCTGVEGASLMNNGDIRKIDGFDIEAAPAYNIVNMRSENVPFHPKGEGNGYIITFGNKRVYIAGDTENTPEMKALKNIEVAFLPMNQPYTMTPEMVADAVKAFRPKIIYPYHYGAGDVQEHVKIIKETLDGLLKDTPGVEVRFPILNGK